MLLLKASRSVRILWHRHDLHSEELWKGWGADVRRLRPQPDHLRLRHQPVGDHQAERHRELHASSDESIAGVNGHRHKCVDSIQRLKKVKSLKRSQVFKPRQVKKILVAQTPDLRPDFGCLKLLIRSSTSTPGVQTNRSTKWQQRSLVAAMNNSPAGGTCHHSTFISFEFWENTCSSEEWLFVSREGFCVTMEQRCDGVVDCRDKSDEVFWKSESSSSVVDILCHLSQGGMQQAGDRVLLQSSDRSSASQQHQGDHQDHHHHPLHPAGQQDYI